MYHTNCTADVAMATQRNRMTATTLTAYAVLKGAHGEWKGLKYTTCEEFVTALWK